MPKPRLLTPSQEQIILSGKHRASELAKMFGVSTQTIYNTAARLGVTWPEDRRTYKPNDDFFKKWTPEMAWVLGVIAADGHVTITKNNQHLVKINIKESDRDMIEKIRTLIEYDGKIYSQKKDGGETQAVLSLTSKEMVLDLKSIGLGQNKTYSLEWPSTVPESLASHFARGYFDGDGCISYDAHDGRPYWRLESKVVGTPAFVSRMRDVYASQTQSGCGSIVRNGNVDILCFGGRWSVIDFLNWIYKDSRPETRLDRKYNIYRGLIDHYGNGAKFSNNSTINADIAAQIRKRHLAGETVASIASDLGYTDSLVHDVVMNRSWQDDSYTPKRRKSDVIYLTYNGETHTIREWSEILGIPYSTIDRRYRMGLPIEQVLAAEGGRLNLGKAKSARDEEAYRIAQLVRQDYKNGIVGKANYEKHGIPKSRYIDLIGNRTCKEDAVWWKDAEASAAEA